ncbi:hypothetical protein P792_11450 [Asaia sp. SF2.1]|nr:hypothetical protein P792_11450 [Asaia sp. SF2.1]
MTVNNCPARINYMDLEDRDSLWFSATPQAMCEPFSI